MNRQYGKITKYQLSKSLIDEILSNSGSSGNGIASISIKKFTKTITSPTNKIEIGSLYFAKETDHLLVFKNSVYLEEGTDYIINSDNTISKADGTQWIASTSEPDVFNFVCLMNIPEEKELHGSKLVDSSVSENKLDIELRDKINSIRSSTTYLSSNNDISITDWSEVNDEGLYTARLTHNLNSEDLMVTIIDKETKRNIMFSCKSIDVNTIELEVSKKANVKILVIDTNSSTFGELIDDEGIHNNKTLSSEKIYSTFALKGENSGGGESGSSSVFKTSLTTSSWTVEGNLKKCTINHNLNTNDIIDVVGYNTSTNNSILFSVKIVDENNVEIKTDEACDCNILVIGAIQLQVQRNIDASNIKFSNNDFAATNIADAIIEMKELFRETIATVTNEIRNIRESI